LIDTPGFDDTQVSDMDILKRIARFLEASYKGGDMLTGVLYFHRISDLRTGGTPARTFRMLRKLCGDETLKNVVIVTNMWGEVDPQVGEAREAQVTSDDLFFKPALDKGAQIVRHANTFPSARAVIRLVLNNHPLPLRIQEELVIEHKDISETGAGEEVNQTLDAQIERHEREMRLFREEMGRAVRDKDERVEKEIEAENKEQENIAKFQNDASRFESDYKSESDAYEARLAQGQKKAKRPWIGVEYTLGGRSFGVHAGSRPAP